MSYNKKNWQQDRSNGYRGQGQQYRRFSDYQGDGVKRSGVVYSRIKKGKHEGQTAVNAWRKTKNGLMTASAFPVDGVEHTGENGKIWLRYVVEVVVRDTGVFNTYWCLMDKQSKKIFIKELGLVISPNGSGVTAKGRRVQGFFGKVFN